jgi:hypothetical protein
MMFLWRNSACLVVCVRKRTEQVGEIESVDGCPYVLTAVATLFMSLLSHIDYTSEARQATASTSIGV